MTRLEHERILLVGDSQQQVHGALMQAMPGAYVTTVGNYFDAIAELSANPYTAVLASIEPVERRPEAAVKMLRQLAGGGRVLLFGHPTLEPLSRKMLEFGCDDYLVIPPKSSELQQMFGTPPLQLTKPDAGAPATDEPLLSAPSALPQLAVLPVAEALLESLLQQPQDAVQSAVNRINTHLPPTIRLVYLPPGQEPPAAPDDVALLSHAVRSGTKDVATLHLLLPKDQDQVSARHLLASWANLVGKLTALQDRHKQLQKLAITDDLTGLSNARYFRYFLNTIVDRARTMRFPVSLLLFDIDDFKHYNDQFGHGVGDEILRQTAALMKRCCRDHDLVARIGGDEFAVVFWEKEGPRQPRDPKTTPTRTPQTPLLILERFKELLKTEQFRGLGPGGQGLLSISGGLAVYPYDAQDVEGLIAAADRELMFRAKRAGKNSIVLVGSIDRPSPPPAD